MSELVQCASQHPLAVLVLVCLHAVFSGALLAFGLRLFRGRDVRSDSR